MPKTRLVQMIPSLPVGGAERMLLHLVTTLDRERYEITVVSFHRLGSTMEQEFAAAGFEVVFLDKRLGFDARTFTRIREVLTRVDPHVVHTHRAVLQYALPALLGRLRGRTVHTVHNTAEREVTGRFSKAGHWIAIRAGIAPVAICQMVADGVERLYGVPPRALIPNGIPVAAFTGHPVTREAWRRKNQVPLDAVVFTCVARLSAQKNVGALVRALATPHGPRKVLVLVCGEGEEQAALVAEAERLGVLERIRFMGSRSDVPDVLGASDVFVLPSLYEGHPLCVMEAMAAGRPVVATAVGGVPEIVRPGETGLLVPPGDVDALAAAMVRLERDPEYRARLGRESSRVAAEHFDVSIMASSYDRLYQEVLASARQNEPR